ncbi:hypothetical protein C8Q74DRAFT_1161126, partial [Fomes fomentarius]
PDNFDGTKTRYDAWKEQANLHVGGVEKNRAISILLSYIHGEHIEQWRKIFTQQHRSNDAWTFATIKDFWDKLDKYFVDPNLVKTAQARLEKCYMGNCEANDFFQDFKELVLQAGFKTTDAHVLDILQCNACPSIIQTIYAPSNEPTGYNTWKLR